LLWHDRHILRGDFVPQRQERFAGGGDALNGVTESTANRLGKRIGLAFDISEFQTVK
jgi:hypothetical protein